MKITLTDKGGGIAHQLANFIGATVDGRYIRIPETKGGGYITGFSFGKEFRVMIRNYYLYEAITIERTNEIADDQDDIVFLMSGLFPPLDQLTAEQPHVTICKHAVSAVMEMPAQTSFGSVTIAVSRNYLRQLFGAIEHPIVTTVLNSKDNFVFETGISLEMIKTGSEMLHPPVSSPLENLFYKLKCEELMCYVFALLTQREEFTVGGIHLNDIKAIYAIKSHLINHLAEPPDIANLAANANMSQPKLRKLFKQTFGKSVFNYYQSARMQRAANLLKERSFSVSEVGYHLGFTNLGHFARAFEKEIGMTPKKYQK